MGSDVIEGGGNLQFRLDRRGACQLAVRRVYANVVDDLRLRGEDLCERPGPRLLEDAQSPLATPPPPAGITRLSKGSQFPMVAVFADRPGSARGADRMGLRPLGGGESFDLAPLVAGQCRYLMAVPYRDVRTAATEADLRATPEKALP